MGTVLSTYPAGLVHELSEITVGSAETCMLAGPSIQVDQGLPLSCIKLPVTSFMGIWGLNSTQAETGLWAPESSRKDKPIVPASRAQSALIGSGRQLSRINND